MRNRLLGIPIEEAPVLPDNTYWEHQLVGLVVQDAQGKELGELIDIIRTGSNDVYVVKDREEKEYLIPAIKEVIIEVDLKKGLMTINPLNGLLKEE